MKKVTLALGIFIVLFGSAFTVVESINWKVKEDAYSVTFKGGKVNGTMKGLKATILFDEANPAESKITATMNVSSINTGNGMMNQHAKSEDALDATKFPEITFESISISKLGTGFEAKGKLTLKGVTKEILLPFTFEKTAVATVSLFKGKITLAPKEYNITRSGTPDNLDIEISLPVTK